MIRPYVRAKKSNLHFIVLMDNCSAHFSEEMLRLADEDKVYFVALPANATFFLQPLDVAFFGPFKRFWRIVVKEFQSRPGNEKISSLPREVLPALLYATLLKMTNMKEIIVNGFAGCGLVPINHQKIVRSKFYFLLI